MGGKTKHLQRTKNNTKPSSSGRSAELLATSTIPTSGFANVSEYGYLPTMLQGFSISDNNASVSEEMDASIDTNFQMVFRKMTKKDPITRMKALQEFIELLGKTDATTIKSILPFWPRLYNNLATDVEHNVREVAQQAQAALVNQVGKGVAPYLKQLAPAWITSQYDTYPIAASTASESFQKSFPSHKLQDVFNFCQNEILDYIIKNLTFHTATTLSSPQSNTPDECEAKYQRVLICSLKGYALYLSKIPPDHLKEASNKNIALLENSKFWSYHKHKNPSIRAAWFEALAALLQYATDLIEKYEKQAASIALQNLDETEPIVLPHVWASILLVTQKINNWQTYINLEKALLPKLWKTLKSGGDGNAETVYPHLLPLLSKLNIDILGDKILPFYRNFFDNIDTGLRSRIIHSTSSRSDITAIATAYYECMQYMIIQLQIAIKPTTELEPKVNEIYEKLLNNHIIEFINFLLETNTSQNGKFVLNRIVVLIKSWSHNKSDRKLYDILLLAFWTELYATIEKAFAVEKVDQHLIKNLNLIAEFVQQMRSDDAQKAKPLKVNFNFDNIEPAAEADGSADKKIKKHISLETSMTEFVIQLCKLYMKKISETNNAVYIGHLETLLKTYGNEELFQKLSGQANDISKLYDKFACWLLIAQLRLDSVVDIILMLYPYLSANEKSKLLNKLVKFPNEIVQYWTLSRILSHPLCIESDVLRLVSQPAVIELLLKSAKHVTNGEVTENINLLHKCFFQNENGDILIDCKTCEAIIEILSKPLNSSSTDDNVLDTCARFLAQVMPIVCSDDQKKQLQIDIFLRLFELSLNKQVYSNLNEDTLWEVITSWQDALSSKDIILDDSLLDSCATIIIQNLRVTVDDNDVSVGTIESISEIVSKLILCSVERFDDDQAEKTLNANKIIKTVFSKLLDEYEENLEKTKQLCSFIECINGQMIPLKSFDMKYNLGCMNTVAVLGNLLKLTIFKFRVISFITCNIKKDHSKTPTDKTVSNDSALAENTDEEHTEDFCDLDGILLKQWSEEMFDEILNGIYVAYLTDTLLENATLPSNIETFIISLQERITQFLKNISVKNTTTIQKHLINETKLNDPFCAASVFCLLHTEPYTDSEKGIVLLHNDLTKVISGTSNIIAYLNVLQRVTGKLEARQLPISTNILNDTPEMFYKTVALRCLIQNYFKSETNEISDQQIVSETLKLVDELYAQSKINKEFLLYNENISSLSTERILQTTEIVEFLTTVLEKFPSDLSPNGWDFIRIAISSWVLSLSKSSDSYRDPKVAVFLASVYRMFKALYDFIKSEYSKSSTKNLARVVDEWESIFAKDVNLILLKCFMKFLHTEGKHEDNREEYFLSSISQFMDNLDFKHVQVARKIDSKTSIDDLIQFALKNLSHKNHGIRIACVVILKKMAPSLIEMDMEHLNIRQDQLSENDGGESGSNSMSEHWHLLHKFNETLLQQNQWFKQYIDEFNYKFTELDGFSEIPKQKSIPFLLMWDCILHICDKAPSELRSIYATFLTRNKYEQVLLNLLFRMMPLEVLRNQESKAAGLVHFVHLSWDKISSNEISTERYACYVYVLSLKHLPAVVRKWWTNAPPRQKLLVDKITTAFVSNQLCNEELRALLDKKDKLDSIQITAHQSTREVHATYCLDDVRMELDIQLSLNHPLGAVKVSCGQQIGDKLQSRQFVMQLSIFLTHQNGSILDGLSIWKRNLDRKFEGVEECYICYSVIHQETCQLPKLSCKTCKKRFHGQCLYKWFNTSNKSSCPICRNNF